MSTAEACAAACGVQSAPGALARVQGLAKRYGARPALAGLSLTVQGGEIIGLVGANGGGKTTSLRILAGLLPPDAGRGAVLGYDLLRERAQIRRRVGYLAQRFSLYANLSVRENLNFRAEVFGVARPRQVIADIIERFGLGPFERLAAGQLSGGWARLLQLAAALVHAPALVLLDEPTAGLDAAARQTVWRHLTRLAAEGSAIVLSTHDLADASRCARIAFLAAGIVRANGPPAEVARTTGATVLVIRGAHVLGLVEPLSAVPGVIAGYPSGDCLRVVVAAGAAAEVGGCAALRQFAVELASPTLEDAVLEWSAVERTVRG